VRRAAKIRQSTSPCVAVHWCATAALASLVRKLVESDEALLTFQILGTHSNAAVQKYLNSMKVPQLFAAASALRFSDPKNFPWTIGYDSNNFVEGRIYGQYILHEYPNAKIGCSIRMMTLARTI